MIYTDEQFADRYHEAMLSLAAEPMALEFRIESGHTGLPRASSLGDCARKQLYDMRQDAPTDSGAAAGLWPSWQGFAAEALARAILTRMGYSMSRPDLPPLTWASGHVDGRMEGLDLDGPVVWDNKARAAYAFKNLVIMGVREFDPVMHMQMQVYMKAMDVERAMITVTPQEMASIRREIRGDFSLATLIVQRLWVEADARTQQLAQERAEALIAANNLDMMVDREFNPSLGKFPCTYCAHITRCMADDLEYSTHPQDMLTIPPMEGSNG